VSPEQTTTVSPEQRFTKRHPCPICGGHDTAPRGQGVRCFGFRSEDSEWARCTREEHRGAAPFDEKSSAYVHKLTGDCKCGVRHDPSSFETRRPNRGQLENSKGNTRPFGRTVAVYDYTDEHGELLFQVVRKDPKSFPQRRPNGRGGWVWDLEDVRRVLYRLSKLLTANQGERIFAFEGEEDVHKSEEDGLTGTTNPGGALKWSEEFSETLRGRSVVIVPDEDPKGIKHAEQVATSLYAKASSVKIVRLPRLEWREKDGEDYRDWRDKHGGTVEELLQLVEDAPEWEPPEPGHTLRKIQINNRHLRDVTRDALEASILANDPPEVFVRAGALVRVREDEHGTPQIQLMELSHVRGRLARVADFVRVTEDRETKVNPPEIVVKDLMALGGWPFPALEAVVEAPILRSNGSIFDTPGYDSETRLFYRPVPGFECPKIPKDPTREAIRAALDLINEAIGEFPYGDKSSAANTLALMLTPLVRQAIPGPVPMALIDKPQAGTGGSLLAETIALIGTGRTAEMLGAPRDDEEWRKQITAKLAAGGTMVTVDNVEGALFAPSLARALTARTWTDRILGRSEGITLSQRATWIATGNNIILRGDLPRRCYWIRLDAKQSRPWQREGFTHPDLLSWVSEKRGELVGALLTIARAWFAAGRPKATEVPRLGSFEAWCEIVGGMVTFAGVGGFLGNLKELYDKADEGNAEWEAFLEEWWKHRGEDPITVKALAKLINDEALLKNALPGDLSEALDKGEGSFTRRLGKALAKRAGTRYGEDGLHITEAGEQRRAKLWSVRDSSGECEFVSFVSLYNPSASKLSSNHSINEGDNTEKTAARGPEKNSTNSQTHTSKDGWELALTEEEERKAQKLIAEGMSEKFAKDQVLRKRGRGSSESTTAHHPDDSLDEDLEAVRELFDADEEATE
jgi:hypothetical protein